MNKSSETVYIGLGSNLGDREKLLSRAIRRISELAGIELVAVSPIYATAPKDMEPDAPAFLNQVIKIECTLKPERLLDHLERIESDLGRNTKGDYRSRTIDLDVLLFGSQRIDTEALQVPHPRLTERAFVLIPLLDIDPDLKHPGLDRPLRDYLQKHYSREVELYRDHIARRL